MAKELEKKQTANQKKEARLEKICKATGWDRSEAENRMSYAKSLGISNLKYVSGKCWEFTDSELAEWKELLDLEKKKDEEDEKWYANVVCEKTGWSYDDALHILRSAREKSIIILCL